MRQFNKNPSISGNVFLFILLCSAGSSAQILTIAGKVRDANSLIGISSVNIFIRDTETGTVTDAGGEFRLSLYRTLYPAVLVFRHVGYDILELPLDTVDAYYFIELQPRVIPLPELSVEAHGERMHIEQDLPQAVTAMGEEVFSGRGYTDAADLLVLDHSVQVDEEISGKKTVAIRGGNPDEVLVLYNHVKLNSTFDHIFDLSFIDLEDIERVEIIKGSNTSLYGTGSLAGIINVVPKIEQDYHIRFQQRLGTYRSGNWGLQLCQNLKRLQTSYSYKKGATERHYSSPEASSLRNDAKHHIANIQYNLTASGGNHPDDHLGAMFIHSALCYSNEREKESLSNTDHILSIHFQGDLFWLRRLAVTSSWHRLDETQDIFQDDLSTRRIQNDVLDFSVEKALKTRHAELLLAYQFEDAGLKFKDHDPASGENAGVTQFKRNHHGFAAISKFHAPSGYDFLSSMDFDLSYRYDRVEDTKEDALLKSGTPVFPKYNEPTSQDRHSWNKSTVKFSTHLSGTRDDLWFSAYMNFGTNIKFPTLFQQIQTPAPASSGATRPMLEPEKNRSTEIGFEMMQTVEEHPQFFGWQVAAYFFKNYYDNKFRTFYTPGIPVAYYDNVRVASITGIEMESGIYLFRKKVTLELGYARYFISDKSAFPFRYDTKATVDLLFYHAGFSLNFHAYTEGEQVGWLRQYRGTFVQIDLPAYADMDIHISKHFEFFRFKARISASVRNLLDSETLLSGLPLRDRRIYLTMGIQY